MPERISAGQSIGLTVPCLQWMGDHPFTVMATGMDDETGTGYLDLAIKANQGLTKKIADVLHVRLEELDALDRVTNESVSVLIEGPYGKVHEQVSTFECTKSSSDVQRRCTSLTTLCCLPEASALHSSCHTLCGSHCMRPTPPASSYGWSAISVS